MLQNSILHTRNHFHKVDIGYALQVYDLSKALLDINGDPFTHGRGLAVGALLIGHVISPLQETADLYYSCIDLSFVSGDKHLMLNGVGGVATMKLCSGHNMSDVEMYCSVASEDFGDWSSDLRGGTFVMGCR